MNRSSTRPSTSWLLAIGLAVGLLLPKIVAGQQPGDRLKVTGRFIDDFFEVERVQKRDSRRDPLRGRIEGIATGVSHEEQVVQMGLVRVRWSPETQFDGVTSAALDTGIALKIKFRQVPGDERAEKSTLVLATHISLSDLTGDRYEILATLSEASDDSQGARRVRFFGLAARIPQALRIGASTLLRDFEDRRPDEQFQIDVLGRPLTIGGEISTRIQHRGGGDLRSSAKDDKTSWEIGGQLELYYSISPTLSVFVETKLDHEREIFNDGRNLRAETVLKRGETWLYFRAPPSTHLSLQIGRQAFRETREWWWDDDLDGIRLYWDRLPLSAEIGVAGELGGKASDSPGIDPEDKNLLRVLARAAYRWHPDHELGFFGLLQRDYSSTHAVGSLVSNEDDIDGDFLWWGLRAMGEMRFDTGGEVSYWLDLANVFGDEVEYDFDDVAGGRALVVNRRHRNVEGWAIDLGVTFELGWAAQPFLTLGYAWGSGDRDIDRRGDQSFRQTGLNDNNGRFEGVNRFRYYGELFDPELSNLHIVTLSIGVPILSSSSIELAYHHYEQDRAVDFIRDTRIDRDPNGRNLWLGDEIDLLIGFEEWERFEAEIVLSTFRAGEAFGSGSGEWAYGGFLRVDWNF